MFGVLFVTAVATAAPSITISPTANGYVAKAPPFEASYQGQVDAEIEGRASELCQGKTVRWGKFQSDVRLGKPSDPDPPLVTGFSRTFSCVLPVERTYAPARRDWKPNTADDAAVREVFRIYYERRDAGNFQAARAMFGPETLAHDSSWSDQMAEFNNRIGTGTRRITGVTWYVNPDGAPHAGIYVAVDFVGDFARTHFYCGFLVFFRTHEGAFEITREEQNQFERNNEPIDQAQLDQMRAAMCRGS